MKPVDPADPYKAGRFRTEAIGTLNHWFLDLDFGDKARIYRNEVRQDPHDPHPRCPECGGQGDERTDAAMKCTACAYGVTTVTTGPGQHSHALRVLPAMPVPDHGPGGDAPPLRAAQNGIEGER